MAWPKKTKRKEKERKNVKGVGEEKKKECQNQKWSLLPGVGIVCLEQSKLQLFALTECEGGRGTFFPFLYFVLLVK